ncbi:hypothetical protein [Elioraea rosea]|uniref:hypothetical protein n=1 Tax=Elioraea rosea TaxID=2492390 RepID=UPI0011841AD5|nr:hypothetical protein [Elioraea rosea]
MIELDGSILTFRFPHLGAEAAARISFHRTLRVPDTDVIHRLPAGLGWFPLKHVDDYADRLPASVVRRGGLIMPMWQAEALWIGFHESWFEDRRMPCAVKIATGKINAVSGERWRDGLHREPQDYCPVPLQPWLDGFKTESDVVRQFVAMPLGAGVTAEEQLTGAAEHGGLQLSVTPLTSDAYARWKEPLVWQEQASAQRLYSESPQLGLAPGGWIRQRVYADDRPLADYDTSRTLRMFVTILDAMAWRHVTGEAPPTEPPTAKEYAAAGIPWFDLYDSDVAAVPGVPALAAMQPVSLARMLGCTDEELEMEPHVVLDLLRRRHVKTVRGWTGD